VSTDIAALRAAIAKANEREHNELLELRAEVAALRTQARACNCPPIGEHPPITDCRPPLSG
jgi:hypothetical protein